MECIPIKQSNHTDFFNQIRSKAYSSRTPIEGIIELTYRCNLKCVHCYIPKHYIQNSQEELSILEIYNILDEIAKEGCLWLVFTGGEIFCRKDFIDIYSYATNRGFIITLLTNGTLITPEIVDYFDEFRPQNIEITIYGATQETYEKITRVSGSFNKCINAISLLSERDIPLKLKSPLLTINRHEILKMKEIAHDYNVEFKFDSIIFPRIDLSREPCDYRLSSKEIIEFETIEQDRLKNLKESFISNYKSNNTKELLFTCHGGRTSFAIDPTGNLKLCSLLPINTFSLRKDTFKNGWYNYFEKVINTKIQNDFNCYKCQLFPLCTQCPAFSYLEHGVLDKIVPYTCGITKLRAHAINMNIIK